MKSLFTIILNDKIVIAENSRSSCLCAIIGGRGESPTFIILMYFSLNYNMKGCDHFEKIFVLSSPFFWLTLILKWIILDANMSLIVEPNFLEFLVK